MPMFDDPRKELQRLQQELLAEEESYEEEYLDEDAWLEQELAEAKALSGYEEPRQQRVRNYANGYGTRQPDPFAQARQQEAYRQSANGYDSYGRPAEPYENPTRPAQPQQRSYLSGYSSYQESRPDYRPNVRDYQEEEVEEEYEEEKGIRGLVTLACLLTAGIVGVAMYWVFVLL